MSYRLVIDYGTHKNYVPFQSEWAAKLRCRDYRSSAKRNGSSIRFHVESGNYVKGIWQTKEVVL